MHRFVYVLALAGGIVWLSTTAADEPRVPVKVQNVPAKDDKEAAKQKDVPAKDVKAQTITIIANPALAKPVVGVKMAVPAKRIAIEPPQAGKEGKAQAGKAKGPVAGKVEKKAVQAVAVPFAAPAMVFQAVGVNAGDQFLPHFQRIHKSELHFMRLVCQCDRQQFEKIKAETEPELKTMAQKFGQKNQNGFVMINAGLAGQESEDRNDANLLVSGAIAKSIRKNLPADMANRYDQEITDRLESSKQAVVLAFVAKMDKVLHLDGEQRDKITKLLNAKWKYSESRSRLLTLGGGMYFPTMPDSEINAILTAPQKRVWSGIQRGNINFGVSLENDGEPEIEEKWDEAPKKAAPVEAKPAEKKPESAKKVQP
ncbi:hypothetical protein BH10PLA2_BH10PLA2_35410 [soil metagenome]